MAPAPGTPVESVVDVPVAIVGAGEAGLMLAHRLGRSGIECVNIDLRTRSDIEGTQRAGILEDGAARGRIGPQGYSADRTTRSGVVALRSVADRLDGRDSARKLQVEAAPRASRELGPDVGVGQGNA